ncbi:isoamylase early set domain-containing protein [Tamlana agarivorans]|uniref:Isoamylase early set domain-containing protein n=1 Tax=Pseudotamlana agarivorans TaxID=481183 RepID=A0ACC5U9A3_9FLAO|nr:isoamylase early set domain-containing protein [Tamlana agarivorans]MBU2950770.1 isoamylase early set domain-containing protein [Tamlana agarivorans]
MAIKKQYLKTKPVCKVTFSIEAADAKKVSLVGTFNDWEEKKPVLKKLKNGTFKGVINLDSGNSYEFKYIVDGVFVNEVEADAYAWNDYAGAENSVLNV